MEFMDLLNLRRSYRSLEPIEITDSIIEEIANSVRLTPSCYNNQPWRYIFIYNKLILEEIFLSLTAGNEWAKKSSMIIVVLSKIDFDCKMQDGRDYYKFDTGMATAVLMLKATELGLIAHPIAGYDPIKIKKALNIDESLEVLTLVIVGKKSKEINPVLKDYQIEAENNRPKRKKIDEFISINKFNDIILNK